MKFSRFLSVLLALAALLAVGPNGDFWAATAGGVVRWKGEAAVPERWTVAEGLQSGDIRRVEPTSDGGARVRTGVQRLASSGEIRDDVAGPAASLLSPDGGTVTAAAAAGETAVLATALGLWRRQGASGWQAISLPAGSSASHVSALAEAGNGRFLAGLFGDGIYELRLPAAHWRRVARAPGVTALAVGRTVHFGTARDGVFDLDVSTGQATSGCCLARRPRPGRSSYGPIGSGFVMPPAISGVWAPTARSGRGSRAAICPGRRSSPSGSIRRGDAFWSAVGRAGPRPTETTAGGRRISARTPSAARGSRRLRRRPMARPGWERSVKGFFAAPARTGL